MSFIIGNSSLGNCRKVTCNGNLKGIGELVKGMNVDDVIARYSKKNKAEKASFDELKKQYTESINDNKNKIYYPGSTIALGFDELGEHGMIVGDITKENVNIDFIRLDDRKFEEIQLKVDDFSSKEDLINEDFKVYSINDKKFADALLKKYDKYKGLI